MKLKFQPTIYDKYIFKQVTFATIGAILLFTIVWIAPEMLLNTIKETLAGEHTVREACLILTLELPKILGKAFPVGLLLGTLFTFDKMSKDCELTIFRAIGMSFGRIIIPVIILSLIITGICYITGDKLTPYAEQKMKDIKGTSERNIQYMYMQKDENGTPKMAVVVSNYNDAKLRNVIVMDFSNKIYDDLHGLTNIYVAPKGTAFENRWELYDVTEYNISSDGVFLNIKNKPKVTILESETASDLKMLITYSVKKEREITNKNLWKYITLLKRENLDEEYNYMLNKYFQRFFHPFICVLLAIMGCLLGFSKPREQRLIGFTIAIGAIFVYYITLPFFDLLAEKGVLHPFLTATIPPLAFLGSIFAFYKSKDL